MRVGACRFPGYARDYRVGVALVTPRLRLTLLGVGAMNSPRYPPAGLLVRYRRRQVMLDGGPGAEPAGRLPLPHGRDLRPW